MSSFRDKLISATEMRAELGRLKNATMSVEKDVATRVRAYLLACPNVVPHNPVTGCSWTYDEIHIDHYQGSKEYVEVELLVDYYGPPGGYPYITAGYDENGDEISIKILATDIEEWEEQVT